jgi:hypothetical protein
MMGKSKHLSKYARLREENNLLAHRAGNAEAAAYWKFKEKFELETAALQAENKRLLQLATDLLAHSAMLPIFRTEKEPNGFKIVDTQLR